MKALDSRWREKKEGKPEGFARLPSKQSYFFFFLRDAAVTFEEKKKLRSSDGGSLTNLQSIANLTSTASWGVEYQGRWAAQVP
jgi:hypothetical protein